MRNIDDLIKEADEVIRRKTEPVKTAGGFIAENDIGKLASALQTDIDTLDYTVAEKLASAVAISNVLLNLPTIQKLAAVEDRAKQAGISEEKISDTLVKNASLLKFRNLLDMI
jgi:hypothetical protein